MGRRLEPRDENELALDDKLDIARTITRLEARIETRHKLNQLEADIKRAHAAEVNSGSVTRAVVPGYEDLRGLLAAGADESDSDTDEKPQLSN